MTQSKKSTKEEQNEVPVKWANHFQIFVQNDPSFFEFRTVTAKHPFVAKFNLIPKLVDFFGKYGGHQFSATFVLLLAEGKRDPSCAKCLQRLKIIPMANSMWTLRPFRIPRHIA